MSDDKFTKIAVGLLTNVRDLVDWGVGAGHTTKEQLRLTVSARKEAVVQLHVKGLSQRQIAATLNVPKSTVHDDLSETGQKVPETGQPIEVTKKDILAAAKEIRVEQQNDKKEARTNREQALGVKQTALPDKKYGVIYGDPPWRFEPWSRETGMDRAADNHYPTLALPEMLVSSLSVKKSIPIAADDCILFLWATVPMLPQAIQLMTDWGFAYRSHVVWAKDRIGTGYWFRNKHELLLVGARGAVPAPAMGTQWPSLIEATVGVHSAKPERFLEMIEAYFPTLPKIELFRRGPARAGWDAWGLEFEMGQRKDG